MSRLLILANDHALPPDFQRMFASQAQSENGVNITVEEIASGDFPQMSKPKETVDFIQRSLAAFD